MPIFAISDKDFTLDGQPFRIISGALHYFRVPPAYWDDRLYKARAMGLNTIETYVPWNLHEPRPGVYHFDDGLDIVAFVEAAARHSLKVIVRPGPYICSEWDFGGLPAWLLKDPQMRLRCAYPPYLQAVERFFDALVPRIAPLQITRGGAIILVQVENEYGSYGDDKTYLAHLRDALLRNGIEVPLFTSDGESGRNLLAGTLNGIHATVNFGFNPRHAFRRLRAFQPQGPLMVTEFWDGWFDHWGHLHQTRSAASMARTLRRILAAGASVNLYMWHGGTNFGFMNGANAFFGKYMPDVTSYDYDAPLSEAGDLTRKYHAMRAVISRFASLPDLPLPEPAKKLAPRTIPITSAISLWDALPALSSPIPMPNPEPMETLDQDYGFILYRTHLPGSQSARLAIQGLRDRAQVFLDGVPLDVLHRNRPNQRLTITVPPGGARLDILVENQGRINFGPDLIDRKGILGGVLLGGHFIFDWQVFRLPLDDLSSLAHIPQADPLLGPGFYRGVFTVEQPLDAFVALPGWTKGVVWVNRHNLGRYWKIGPQRTLYLPAPFLRPCENEIILFEQHRTRQMQVALCDRPKL